MSIMNFPKTIQQMNHQMKQQMNHQVKMVAIFIGKVLWLMALKVRPMDVVNKEYYRLFFIESRKVICYKMLKISLFMLILDLEQR